MSTIYDIVLTTPHADYRPGHKVERGLADLGFMPDPEGRTVWLRLSRTLPATTPTIDALEIAVRGLPWHCWSAPTDLQVLYTSEHDTADDSFGGRVSPYSWHTATWRVGVPSRP